MKSSQMLITGVILVVVLVIVLVIVLAGRNLFGSGPATITPAPTSIPVTATYTPTVTATYTPLVTATYTPTISALNTVTPSTVTATSEQNTAVNISDSCSDSGITFFTIINPHNDTVAGAYTVTNTNGVTFVSGTLSLAAGSKVLTIPSTGDPLTLTVTIPGVDPMSRTLACPALKTPAPTATY